MQLIVIPHVLDTAAASHNYNYACYAKGVLLFVL